VCGWPLVVGRRDTGAGGYGGVDGGVDMGAGVGCVGRGVGSLDANVSRPDAVQLRLAQRCPMPLLKTGGVETERVGTGQLVMKQLGAAVECTP